MWVVCAIGGGPICAHIIPVIEADSPKNIAMALLWSHMPAIFYSLDYKVGERGSRNIRWLGCIGRWCNRC